MAGTLGQEDREEHAVAAHRAHQVHVDDALPRFDRDVLDRTDGEDPGVAHDDVDATELRERAIAGRFQVGVTRHVAARGRGGGPDAGRDAFRPVAVDVDVGDQHPRAAPCERSAIARPIPLPAPVITATAVETSMLIAPVP